MGIRGKDEIRFKTDVQQAIANNGKRYSTIYRDLVFQGEDKEYLKSLFFMKKVEINVIDEELNFNIELDDVALSIISKEEMKKIKEINARLNMQELIIQKSIHDAFEGQVEVLDAFMDEFENFEEEYRKPSEEEKEIINSIKKNFKDKFNLNLEIEESTSTLGLAANFKSIELNKKMIKEILSSSKKVDNFSILPYIEENSHEINGVRLFWGIYLDK